MGLLRLIVKENGVTLSEDKDGGVGDVIVGGYSGHL